MFFYINISLNLSWQVGQQMVFCIIKAIVDSKPNGKNIYPIHNIYIF